MATPVPSIEVSAPGGIGSCPEDDDFEWSVMALVGSPPKGNQGKKRKSFSRIASPSKVKALDEDVSYVIYDDYAAFVEQNPSEEIEDPSDEEEKGKIEIPQIAYDTLRAARPPLTPKKSLSGIGLSPNKLQVGTNGNLDVKRSPNKRKSENWDEIDFSKSPAKFVAGSNNEKLLPGLTTEHVTLQLPEFPAGVPPIRSPKKAIRRLSGAFASSN